jgi:hypothetical protein
MASLVLTGDTSGQVTIAAPAVAGTNTLTLQAATATNAVNTLATSVASTSGTSIDFTGLPAWVKRITVMCIGVSQNSAGQTLILQIGAGSVTTSGYSSSNAFIAPSTDSGGVTTGFPINRGSGATAAFHGIATICSFGSNSWVFSSTMADTPQTQVHFGAGSIALGGTLDRVRLTTIGGTATFDAGSINILYEG